MKLTIRVFVLLSTCFLSFNGQAKTLKQFMFQACSIELLDSAGAANATGHPDAYTNALQAFDLQIRLGREENASEQEYLQRAATQAMSWTEEDQQKLQQSMEEIAAVLTQNNIRLQLPDKIQFLKTAGGEEFEAEGYTRENRIMLCLKNGQEITTHIVAHELFHVFSRYNAATRDKIYALFGFEKSNRINTYAAMQNRVITNPDCPFIEHFIPLQVNGKEHYYVLQLYSTEPFNEQYSLKSANVALLEVVKTERGMEPLVKDGSGVLLQLDEVPQLFEKISQNTPYVLHAEEIAAEHFAMWIVSEKVPQQEYFDRLKMVLAAK